MLRPVVDGPWSGWSQWQPPECSTFIRSLGSSYVRGAGPRKAIVAFPTSAAHCNGLGVLHGGFVASFADHAYSVALAAMERPGGVANLTVDLGMQYFGTGRPGAPLVGDVELLRETGRMLFLRMTVSQEGEVIAASSVTMRKLAGAA
ncbi:MAG: PaaI family thioesterase [Sphingobium sp.]